MANDLDETLSRWTALADDDVDLRTDEGVTEAARRLSAVRNISFEDALAQTKASVERRRAASQRASVGVWLT